MKTRASIVVLISGQGSNLQAILDACDSGELAAKVVAVIANKAEALGLERARKHNVPTVVKIKTSTQSRAEYDQELADLVARCQPDWIVLAGWMRLLSPIFLNHFHHKVINLHPALPGAFPGVNAIERALIAYQQGKIQHTGVMVHLVPDEGVDSGPVLNQVIVPIYPEDNLALLSERVHQAEHQLLITTLNDLINQV